MKKVLKIITLLLFFTLDVGAQGNLIPEPVSATWGKGFFTINSKTAIVTENVSEQKKLCVLLDAYLKHSTGLSLYDSTVTRKKNSIQLRLNKDPEKVIGNEGYHLEITENNVILTANKSDGLFNGIQTLIQLVPDRSEGSTFKLPVGSVTDYPRFAWRGLMLDASRHFFSVEEVKKFIDEMVRYKFNLFHWHLTDDQGWRIEIKAFPELTKVGAWRVPRTGLWWEREPTRPGEQATYGGFYTQEQIREIVRYAAERKVQVMPEIDIPGHSLAAIAAYPYLSCTKLKYSVNPGSKFYKIDDNALCAGNDSSFAFLDKVFSEVATLFPFEFIHIGGDECYKGFWKSCKTCQQKVRSEGLKDEDELQSYFIKRVEKIVQSKGKRIIGWDEILEGGLAPDATVMSWRGMKGGIEAANDNHQVVMSPASHCYFDLYQGDPAVEPATYSMLRLRDVYKFEPAPAEVNAKFILGGQANLWTESVPTFRHAEYMLWPRALALSEVLWSPKSPGKERDKESWDKFIPRMEKQLTTLEKDGVNFSTSFYDPIIIPSRSSEGKLLLEFDTEVEGLEVYYSFDNTYPDQFSSRYPKGGQKIGIPEDAETLRVISFRNGKPVGKMITVGLDEVEKRIKKKRS